MIRLVEAIECDMGSLDWKPETIDLLWSEGAAYNLTFEGALKAWRPLMAANGIAVISEMSYFTSDVPESVRVYWQNAYPTIGTDIKETEEEMKLFEEHEKHYGYSFYIMKAV